MIEDLAKEIASEFWDDSELHTQRRVKTAVFREAWPNREWYVRCCWPHWIRDTRYILAEWLKPESMKPEEEKEAIYDALTNGFDKVTQFFPPPEKLYG